MAARRKAGSDSSAGSPRGRRRSTVEEKTVRTSPLKAPRVPGGKRAAAAEAARARRMAVYRNIPIGDYVRMSGRQQRTLIEQAARYGLPIGERTVDLTVFLRALHDFLALHGRKLMAPETGDPLMVEGADAKSGGLERYRNAAAALKELELAKERNRVVEVEAVLTVFELVGSRIRRAVTGLVERFGNEVVEVMDEALTEAGEAVERAFPQPVFATNWHETHERECE